MKKVFLVLLIFIFSCETVVDLDVPPHEPLLVVNGMLESDLLPSVLISHSLGAFEQGEINFIDDANIVLYEDGEEIGQMIPDLENVDDSLFVTNDDYWWGSAEIQFPIYYNFENIDFRPNDGSVYSIEVAHPDYPLAFAETQIPNSVDIDTLIVNNNFEEFEEESEFVYGRVTLKLIFEDNEFQNNYYRIRLLVEKEIPDDDGLLIEKVVPLELHSNDPSLSQSGFDIFEGYTFRGRSALFNDGLFNGERKEMTFDLDYKFDQIQAGDELSLQFTSFSEEGYKYFNSIELNQGGSFSPFGTEPIPFYSNIENGIGIFGSGNSRIWTVQVALD